MVFDLFFYCVTVKTIYITMNVIVAVCYKVDKTQRRVILSSKILDVILKCGTEYSGFEPVLRPSEMVFYISNGQIQN